MARPAASQLLPPMRKRGPRRALMIPVVAALALGLSACVGKTYPATNVTNVSAQLNARGYTDGGPATWWWEYDTLRGDLGTANDTEVCGNPHQPDRRCGPAQGGSRSNQVPLSVTVSGLTPDTRYFFRACGQDVNDPGPSCAQTRSFKTLAGTSYVFDRKWGSQGSADGQFSGPVQAATDSSNNVYVADNGNDRVQKFSSAGAFITKWGSNGPGDGQFGVPDPRGGHGPSRQRLRRRPRQPRARERPDPEVHLHRRLHHQMGRHGTGPNQFRGPAGVAVDSAGAVYVADYDPSSFDNHRVKKFSSTGAFITQWGSFGSGDGQFREPTAVATDPAGNVYVADSGNHRIQKFSSTGAFVTKWGSFGSGEGQFNVPCAVATDSAGNVYVADNGNDRVQKFSSTGAFITEWGGRGSGDGQFSTPCGIAVDSVGNVYVTEYANNRVQKFKPVQ